jgi:hypothetical protein
MNYLYLSPHFPPNYYLFCVHLRRLGVNVLGIADEPYERLQPEVREALTKYYRVDDMHSYDQLVRACGYFTHHYGKLNRVDSHTEYWMETEARLRTDFNIFGPKIADLATIQRKSLMKQKFEQAGVPAARGTLVRTLDQARSFAHEVGYPLVAKPDIGVGAAHTFKIGGDSDLERFYSAKPPVEYLLEEFVQGDICTFDGLADKDGSPVFFSSMRYSQGVMETVNEDLHIYFYNLREIPPDLEDAGRRVLKAFDVRERFFHFEFFRTHDAGRLVALEVNMRPPGGPIVDMYNYAHDIDLYWEWANIVVNNRFSEPYSRKYHVCYVGRKFNKPYTHTHEEIMAAFGHCIVHHMAMPGVFSLAMGDLAYLVRTSDLAEMLAAAGFIQKTS